MENENYNNIKKYNMIDLMRFVAAILVICIHTRPFEQISWSIDYILVDIIARIAVPFFFITSGFFYYKKIQKSGTNNNYILRLIKLYLIATVIYLPLTIYKISNSDNSILKEIMIFFRSFVFAGGSASQLWYFTALIFDVFVINIMLKKHIDIKKIFAISIVFYFLGLIAGAYYGIVQYIPLLNKLVNIYLDIFITARNGLFVGLAFTSMGMLIYDNNRLRTKKQCLIRILVFGIGLVLETILIDKYNLAKGHNALIMLLPLSYYIFTFLIQIDINGRLDYKKIRKLSTLIFIFHIIIRDLIQIFLSNNIVVFLSTTLISILISIIILKLENIKGFKWLENLH